MLAIDLVDCSRFEPFEGEWPISRTDQPRDLHAEIFENAPYLAILALGQAHFDPAIAAGAAFQIGVDGPVGDAFDRHAVGEIFKLVLRDSAERAGSVGPDDTRPGKLQLALEFAVIGQE